MKDASAQVNITINGRELLVDEGISILQAARQNDIYIPTLCHHPALSDWGGCRLCVVEIDGSPKLAASCVTPVRGGMTVITENERIIESRRIMVEFLFAERNHNCMFCPRSGDCELQRLAYELQMDHLTVSFSYKKFPTDITSRYMALDHNRCVLCGRCVRACQEIAGGNVLGFHHRGPKTMIGMDLQEERAQSTCLDCGVCLQVCPTGAIYNRFRSHYAVKGHQQTRETVTSFCPMCGLMCPTDLIISNNQLIQVDGRLSQINGRPDKGQLCHIGRFQIFQSPAGRLLQPLVRKGNGAWEATNWQSAIELVVGKMAAIQARQGGTALFGLASSMLSIEELVLFKELMEKGWNAGYVDTFDGPHFRNLTGAWKNTSGAIREISWKQIAKSDFVLIVGGNPDKTQPLLLSLLRKRCVETDMRVALIGPMEERPPFVTDYLQVAGYHMADLLRALLAESNGLRTSPQHTGDPQNPTWLSQIGLAREEQNVFQSIARLLVEAQHPFIIVDTSVTGMADCDSLAPIIDLAGRIAQPSKTESNLLILKPVGNSAGAWRTGVTAQKTPDQNGRLKGGLILTDDESVLEEEVLAWTNAAEFLAVITPYAQEVWLARAHVLIPKPSWLEADGSYLSLDAREQVLRKKSLQPPEGVRSTWEILSAMGEKTGWKGRFSTWEDLRKQSEALV